MARYDLPKLRKTLQMTQSQLARLLQISQGFLSSVENGRNPFPDERVDDLQKIFPNEDLSDYEVAEQKALSSIGSDNLFSQVQVNDPETLKALMEYMNRRTREETEAAQEYSNACTQYQERILSLTTELENTRKEKYEYLEEVYRLRDLLRANGIDYAKKSESQ